MARPMFETSCFWPMSHYVCAGMDRFHRETIVVANNQVDSLAIAVCDEAKIRTAKKSPLDLFQAKRRFGC